jgi:hypothetical protein
MPFKWLAALWDYFVQVIELWEDDGPEVKDCRPQDRHKVRVFFNHEQVQQPGYTKEAPTLAQFEEAVFSKFALDADQFVERCSAHGAAAQPIVDTSSI